MTDKKHQDWDPFSETAAVDQRSAYDHMREHCPVAWSKPFGWTLFRHQDIEQVLHDPECFSNKVSRHLSVPNGMDPPDHTVYRQLIEPYLSAGEVEAFRPACARIAAEFTNKQQSPATIEFMHDFARPFAARIQCAFLGWPDWLSEPLCQWTIKNQRATRAQDKQTLTTIAGEFKGYVLQTLRDHKGGREGSREQSNSGNIISRLQQERVYGRPLTDEELVSILRNWTVGEIGTLSAAIGILVHFLSRHTEHQERLRGDISLLPGFIEEVLRLHGPLIANRRVATRTVDIGDRQIREGDQVQLNWIAANRDPRVFASPDSCQLDRDQSRNLLWGSGIHYCPGASLARMEMCIAVGNLLDQTQHIKMKSDCPPVPARYPASGFESLPISLY